MKIICIIQRYGSNIIGGAEMHCRLVAKRLSILHEIEIVTTCAVDYLTWKNEIPAGTEEDDGLMIHRFRSSRERTPDFDVIAYETLQGVPGLAKQEEYLAAHGPFCPDMIQYLVNRRDADCFIFFSYRYWTTFQGILNLGKKSILVPTAENDAALHLPIYRRIFQSPAVIAYNSIEEKEIINRITANSHVPSDIVGVGLVESEIADIDSTKRKYDLDNPYIIYVGRIEHSKGCDQLADYFMRFLRGPSIAPDLVFVGQIRKKMPDHAKIRCIGILSEDEKLALIRGAVCLVMPSRYESLSMALLEAWKMNTPALCNANCEVLRGQCIRSGGGLFYRNYDEFEEALKILLLRPDLRIALGAQGARYFQNNYSWEVIERKYAGLLAHFSQTASS